MYESMAENPVTREEAVALATLIKERCIAEYQELLRMPPPATGAAEVSRRARLESTSEELARQHEYAAAHAAKLRQVRRLASTHKKIQSQLADGTFAGMRTFYDKIHDSSYLQISS